MGGPYRTLLDAGAPEPDLGPIVSLHRTSHRTTWLGVVVLVLLAVPIAVYLDPAGLLAAMGVLLIWLAANLLASRAVELHADGVIVRGWIGTVNAFRFDDCVSVFYELGVQRTVMGPIVSDSALRLESDDGAHLRISHGVADAEALFAAIARRCVRPVHDEALRAFQAGEPLTFGPLVMTREGLTIDAHVHPWSEIEKVEASPQRVFVHLRGKLRARSFAFDRIPFAFAFLAVLGRAGVRVEGIDGFVTRT